VSLKELAKTHFDIDLSSDMLTAFETYQSLLIDWNQRMNLTSITQPDAIRVKHFLDSLSLFQIPNLPERGRFIDVGTGAGLPGFALKFVRPAWRGVLIDSTRKKIDFLNHVIETLALDGVRAEQLRAEDAGQRKDLRERFDLVTARAVARMPILAEYLLPLCAVGGLCVAMKGETAQTETDDAAWAIQTLGGEVENLIPIQLPDVEQTHYLVCIRKVAPTPKQYPRRAGVPSKDPILP
jgi:16S rRNA (guanine527-N7)-methyltransferase